LRSGVGLALRLLSLGWLVALSILLGVVGGLWLDGVLDTRPLFILLGLIIGSVLAFYGVYKMVSPLFHND
jgi:ATP synthase protein I